jgi:hypothetical protein
MSSDEIKLSFASTGRKLVVQGNAFGLIEELLAARKPAVPKSDDCAIERNQRQDNLDVGFWVRTAVGAFR